MRKLQINAEMLEGIIREIIAEKTAEKKDGVIKICAPEIKVSEADRLDTGTPAHRVYTKDLFTLSQSPRLGCGIMEMTDTTFDWTLGYDEIDYVIDGKLSIVTESGTHTAEKGELILIPKDSKIKFSVSGFARFLYVTYPADWNNA